jgi:hypothetical protein
MEERCIRFPKKDFEQTKIKYREAHKRGVVQQTKGHIRHIRDQRRYVDVARRESGVSVFGRRSTSRFTVREVQSTALVDAALWRSGVAIFRRRSPCSAVHTQPEEFCRYFRTEERHMYL